MSKDINVIKMNSAVIPNYTEYFNVNGVVDYGHDNLFPQFLQDLATKCPIQGSIIKTKAMLIAGNGINRDNISDAGKVFLNNIYSDETIDDIVMKLARDLETYGGFSINPIWSRDKESIAQVEYIDFSTLRKHVPNKNKTDDVKFWISNNWSLYNVEKTLLPEFSTRNRSKASQILYVVETNIMGDSYYARPTYISALKSIETDISLAEFHRNNIDNGFAPSLMIDIIAGMNITEEQKDDIVRGLVKQYGGRSNAGKVMVTFSPDDTKRTNIQPIELNSSDERFMELEKSIEKKILIAHQVTQPKLVGVISDSGSIISSDTDLLRDLAIFNAVYIRPKQIIIEREINRLARINGITDKFVLNPCVIEIPEKMNSNDMISILTAQLSDEQKIQIFIMHGFTRQDAESLVINKNKVDPNVS